MRGRTTPSRGLRIAATLLLVTVYTDNGLDDATLESRAGAAVSAFAAA